MDSAHARVLRDSMTNNPLIMKDTMDMRTFFTKEWKETDTESESEAGSACRDSGESYIAEPKLGKTKSGGQSYPGPDFVYGVVTTYQDGGVAEAISSWHTPSLSFSSSAQHRKPERDFVALNREGVKSGLVTAKELQQYRATHDIKRPVASKISKSAPARIPQDITFGLPTRPSTPISALLAYQYGRKWVEEQQAKDRALLEHQNKKFHLSKIQDTRTTLLRKSRPLEEPPSTWQLPRFQQIGPALDTFRDPEARKKAMDAHYMDSVARRALLGQGTYTVD